MPDSVIGFGGGDWLIFGVTALLILLAFTWTRRLQNQITEWAGKTRTVMIFLFVLPIALRIALLPNHPVPVPTLYDEFSHLLAADTLLHFRLANPPHALHKFFETFFVLQEPTYSSIYPPGQGLTLAFGRAISGLPWTGVLAATGALCALCYWALKAYVEPGWALLGGLLAVMEFGPLSLWMNSYWGGSLAAAAGCLVFGSLPRLCAAWRNRRAARRRDALLLGAGFGLHLLTRQFESTLLLASIFIFVMTYMRRLTWRPVLHSMTVALLAAVPAAALIVLQNKQVTGSWTTLPEQLSQFQYGVPTTLTIEAPAKPHNELTPQQAMEYRSQLLMHGATKDTPGRFLLRLEYRVRDYRFFFLPPLYLALAAFLFAMGRNDFRKVAGVLVIFALGTNLFPYLLVHYLAAVVCLFVLVSVTGLRKLNEIRVRSRAVGSQIVQVLVLLCGAQFIFWYGIHVCERFGWRSELLQYETWDAINHETRDPRAAIRQQLEAMGGQLLVFVHYSPRHIFQNEWVWNAANIDDSQIVWARDLGQSEDEELIRYYPRRHVVRIEADATPVTFTVSKPE